MKYKKGTQEMLDAAKDDATLLPFDTVFVTTEGMDRSKAMPIGIKVVRGAAGLKDICGNKASVAFQNIGATGYWYVSSDNLLPAKKSKPKKWQNGTQEQLDAAKDDARLIPKKTYFCRPNRDYKFYRVDSPGNDAHSVMMIEDGGYCASFCRADELEPIND